MILSVHVIEHFWRWEALDVLREWLRVLKPGGVMILECPNLATACAELLKDPDSLPAPVPKASAPCGCCTGIPDGAIP